MIINIIPGWAVEVGESKRFAIMFGPLLLQNQNLFCFKKEGLRC